MAFSELVDLASERLGGRVLSANDEFFAPKQNLLKTSKPIFLEHKYTDRGKWMDGWETRRRRTPGFDWCIIRLGLAGMIRGVVVDTSYFRGNFPEYCSIEACEASGNATSKKLESKETRWVEILPKTALKGDTQNLIPIQSALRCTHLRFKIYPDGGVARLRVHGEVVPDMKPLAAGAGEIDLVAVENGGRAIISSDQFFNEPLNLLMPGRGKDMSDGWETKRRRGPGFDWVVLQLGIEGTIRGVEVDTAHFKGNFPESCSLEACHAQMSAAADLRTANLPWKEILPRTKLKANARHVFRGQIQDAGVASHVRFNIYPDGGVSRLRIFGTPGTRGERADGVVRLNAKLEKEAEAALLDCCGARHWAQEMVKARPFVSASQMFETAERIWMGLRRDDWLEAFRHHPKIGRKKAAARQSGKARQWSKGEQAAAQKAPAKILAELGKANREYEKRFGFIFIICAAGKSSEEILASLKQRMANDAETELRVAAEEQSKITRLRLEKLIEGA
jgi:allantoicase